MTAPAPTRYAFDVIGHPAHQGSKRHVGGGRMVEMSKKVGPWRDSVAHAAMAAMGAGPGLTGPVELLVTFQVPMPASRRAVDRHRGWRWADRRPDLDKLLRSTLDGLTASGIIEDDARVVAIHAHMIEVAHGWTGAKVRLCTGAFSLLSQMQADYP